MEKAVLWIRGADVPFKVAQVQRWQKFGACLPGLAAGIPNVGVACSAGLVVVDEMFDGGQRVRVEAGRSQLVVQLSALGGPAVADAFGLVEGGVGG